jgi:hypothetical protein
MSIVTLNRERRPVMGGKREVYHVTHNPKGGW